MSLEAKAPIAAAIWRWAKGAILERSWLLALAFIGMTAYLAWQQFSLRHVTAHMDMLGVESLLAFDVIPSGDLGALASYGANEHRPLVPTVFYLLDHLYFASTGVLLIATSYALALAIAWMLSDLFSLSAEARANRWLAFSIAAAFLFWPLNFENLVWPMQVHVFFGLGFALWALRRWASTRCLTGRQAIFLSILGLLGSFSFGYGAIGYVVLAFLMLFTAATSQGRVVFFSGFFATMATLAFLWVPLAHHGDPIEHLWRVGDIALYVMAFLGALPAQMAVAPGTSAPQTELAVAFGGVGLLLSAVGALWLWRQHRHQPLWEKEVRCNRFAVALMLFALATALFTAVGRIDFGTAQALSNRYLFLPIFFWLGLMRLISGNLARWRLTQPPRLRLLRRLSLFLMFAILAAQVPRGLDHAFGWSASIRQAALATALGIDDWDQQRALGPFCEQTNALHDYYRQTERSIYRQPWAQSLGQPLADFYTILSAGDCNATLVQDAALADRPEWRQVWGFATRDGANSDWLILADEQGLVTGFGSFEVLAVAEVKGYDRGEAFLAFLPVRVDKSQTLFISTQAGACPALKL